ncbi:MAG: DUF6089 family protein, partial [Bacteroidota bacterium]
MRRNLYSLLLLVSVSIGTVSAQYNEAGLMVGWSSYKGELTSHLFKTEFNHLAGGVFFRHNWNRHWSWKIAVNYGKVSGDDAASDYAFQRDRNLSFYSNVLDISPLIEFNFFPYETGNRFYPFTPYLFTGLSVFRFNPKAELGNDVYELQPLTTEGQKPYKKTSFAIPIGGGIKFSVGRVGIGVEVGARKAFTDYLDDVSTVYPNLDVLLANKGTTAVALSDRSFSSRDSLNPLPNSFLKQRGNAKDKDWYLFGGMKLYFRLTSLLRDIGK